MQGVLFHVGIGQDEAEHGGHIGLNHAGAFGETGEPDGLAADFNFNRQAFGDEVGGHHRFRGIESVVRREVFVQFLDSVGNFIHRQEFTDGSGGADKDIGGVDAERAGSQCGHGLGVGLALRAGAGVGDAAVHHNRSRAVVFNHLNVPFHRGGFDLVGGEDAGGDGRGI